MTDNDKAERFALKMIRERKGTIACWAVSKRTHAALVRLERRGVIRWCVRGYPYWGFEIMGESQPRLKGK